MTETINLANEAQSIGIDQYEKKLKLISEKETMVK